MGMIMTSGDIECTYGRPRLQATIERDRAVYDVLSQPMTLPEIADVFNLSHSLTYQSLNRLRKSGKVQIGKRQGKSKTHFWYQVE